MNRTANIVRVSPDGPERELIENAVSVIRQGGVVVFPTSGLYGLGSDAFNVAAVERIYRLKGRDPQNPILVLIDNLDMMERLAARITPAGRYLMERLWPGRVTLVVNAGKSVPQVLTGATGKIGIRQAAHPVAMALVRALKSPLTGTSANISGGAGCPDIGQLDGDVKSNVDLILDAGTLAGGSGSTVVDVTGHRPRIIRHGAVPDEEIMDLFHQFGVNHVDNAG